ncbi:MAG: GNAT family N-acetyltransferase [Desulfatiglandales bacterium]
MGLYNIEKIFDPKSVAVIGASDKKGTIGYSIISNLVEGGYEGRILPVNPKYSEIQGARAFKSISEVDAGVDLAVIATPMSTVTGIVSDCVKAGVGSAVIISAGGREIGEEGLKIEEEIDQEARKGGLRIVGPNCMGIIRPGRNLNASFAARMPYRGNLAFVSQSGAICSAMLDLSLKEKMGFSYFVSIGSMLDVDFGDLVDYLGDEPEVKSILLYIESLTNIRKFMSAVREVSRVKPVVVLKAGTSPAGAKAAASHTGALAGENAVYDAAFRRGGIVRVHNLEDFFDCAELLAKQSPPKGKRLMVITNSGGPGVMAADAAAEYGLDLNPLSEESLNKLDEVLPPHWSRGNPIDILGDAGADRYARAAECCFGQGDMDGMLVICNPQAMTDAAEVARSMAGSLKDRPYPVFAAWMGGEDMEEGIDILNRAGIPTYGTPERAVRSFMYLHHYFRNLEMLQEIPSLLSRVVEPDREKARQIVQEGLKRENGLLSEVESKRLLACYGTAVNRTEQAASVNEAVELAREIGYPVVMKIHSNKITHKTEAGGVKIDLQNDEDIRKAYDDIIESVREFDPDAADLAVSLQPMIRDPDVEILLGAKKDKIFGPVVLFGLGGIFAEVLEDRSLGLPPLNQTLARRLMEDTRVFRILKGYRSRPAANLELLEQMIVCLSHLLIDFPEITELDMNPVILKAGRPCAVDARVVVKASDEASPNHLAIRPYPEQYESRAVTKDGVDVFVRPIRPEDAPLLLELFDSMSMRSRYYRFLSPKKSLSREMLVRLTQVDYDRHIALVALREGEGGEKMMGVVRIISDPDKYLAEFSVAVADAWQGKGIGGKLLERALDVAVDYGIKKVQGEVLGENKQMLDLSRRLGFEISRDGDAGHYLVTKEVVQDESMAR